MSLRDLVENTVRDANTANVEGFREILKLVLEVESAEDIDTAEKKLEEVRLVAVERLKSMREWP